MIDHITLEERQARFLKCIGEPTRLQILRLLTDGEKCVSEIIEALGKEQSLISHHLRSLKTCNIVRDRQEAQKIYYRVADNRIIGLILDSEALIQEILLCNHEEVVYAGKGNQGGR